MVIQLYDELLDEEQVERLEEKHGDLQFATVVFDQDGQIAIDLDTEHGVSAGVPRR